MTKPSEIRAYIERLLATASEQAGGLHMISEAPYFGEGQAPQVRALLEMLDSLDPGLVEGSLPAVDRARFLEIRAALQHASRRWDTEDERIRRTTGGHTVRMRRFVDLHSLLSSLPDDISPKSDAALLDPVTGLLPRGAWDAAIASAVGSLDEPLAVVMCDIDHFKMVNDIHGHPKGDEVLLEVGVRISNVVTGKGSAYRYGGEEVALLLPNHSLEEALAVAERARRSLADTPCAGIAVTASFGVAVMPMHAANSTSLVANADKALYDAKHKGRNLVRYFSEPEPPLQKASREPERRQPAAGAWTDAERQSIRLEYLRSHVARCPQDGALLDIRDGSTFGDKAAVLLTRCPNCGESAAV